MNSRDLLSPADIEHAWISAYQHSLDENPDIEIDWEARTWRAWGVESIAAVGEALLAERRETETSIRGATESAGLDKMLASVDHGPVLRLCRDEGLCLLAATRLVYWSGLREIAP